MAAPLHIISLLDSGSETEVYYTDDDDDDDFSDPDNANYYGATAQPGTNPFPKYRPSKRPGRKNIREVISFNQLSYLTKVAYYEELNKKKRVELHRKQLTGCFSKEDLEDKLILDFDEEAKTPTVAVHPVLVNQLKNHQKEGIRFMWEACFETVSWTKSNNGHGCILAHCMGLGKTLQVISLIHTILTNHLLGMSKVLVLCPKNTVLNWVNEFSKWIKPPMSSVKIFNPTRFEESTRRLEEIRRWERLGGVCVLNYDAFRILLEGYENPKLHPTMKSAISAFVDPGPDLIVCDEGHILKNMKTKLSKVMYSITTTRRILLTGTPLQNNLIEYYCMVNFVRPHLLGSLTEFRNMFVNPILNGQYENSLQEDVKLMKERSHILHKSLTGCVQRQDYTTLAAFLPEKHEYVICVRITETQINLYRHYLEETLPTKKDYQKLIRYLFPDYQLLQRVWTHPFSLKLYDERPFRPRPKKRKRKKNEDVESDEDDDDGDEEFVERPPRWIPGWWTDMVDPAQLHDVRSSAKVVVLFDIIRQCEENNEKLLVFSRSLFSLDMLEYFLKRANRSADAFDQTLGGISSSWDHGYDYFRMTGETSGPEREEMCQKFNDQSNSRSRLFLISTKAGGIGINLVAANRCVIFDASWNPADDEQSIFRIYRLGQTKPCFVYRLIASGTMEEKIYERQVTKQSTSRRVVDEKQITRHYTLDELKTLYELDPDKQYINPIEDPKDNVLKALLDNHSDIIGGYHEHDSLLKHRVHEELHESEKAGAWTEFSDTEFLAAERLIVDSMTPDRFSMVNFKMALRKKYPYETEDYISDLARQLLPRIEKILKRSNLKEFLMKAAINCQTRENTACGSSHSRPLTKPKAVPLRVWGTLGGRQYGATPFEEDSD